jgi:signal transduction histidine kinase
MHGRFSRRLFLYFAVTLLALAVGVGMATIIPLLNRLTRSEEAGLAHVAETQALAVGEWFRRAEDLARQITSRSQIREALEDLNEGRITHDYFADFAQPKLIDAMNRSGDVAGITRLATSGAPLVSCGVPIPREAWRVPPPHSNQLLVSAPLLLSGRRCIVIGAPILGRDGSRVGTDLVAVDTALLREKIIQPMTTDDSGSLALGCKGNKAVQPFLVEPASRTDAITPVIHQALALALDGRSGILSAPDAVVAYTPIADTGWGLTLSTDSRRLYAPVHAKLVTMLTYTAGIYLLCLVGFGILLRPLAGRILLHADELAAMVEKKTRQLTTELTARAAAEKALQEARDELELRVKERTRKLAEANVELLALHERLQGEFEERKALSKELINLLEGMRLDLSRDLHDHTGQLLTTLRLHLNAALRAMPAGEDACRAQLESAEEKVNQVQCEIKTIARGLRPDTLDYLGLAPSLEALIDEQRASSERNFHFFHNQVPADFDRDKALALYRIAQESLSNIIRHAHAANVHITLVRREQFLTLSVEDDGVGFDMTTRAAGSQQTAMSLGLTLMRERMIQLGGTLLVESAPGQGTHIVAELEL